MPKASKTASALSRQRHLEQITGACPMAGEPTRGSVRSRARAARLGVFAEAGRFFIASQRTGIVHFST